MTLNQKDNAPHRIEGAQAHADNGKPLRPVRNRRHTRRGFAVGQRPQKRLFTPEIKRYLKDWLVRRRENPYPNREEKKYLARETGLTYIQICNWFANWRRKLKNVNMNMSQQSWGHLIRTYNDRAQGNVEQFSICSDDSIWSEPEPSTSDDNLDMDVSATVFPNTNADYQKDFCDSSTTSKGSYDSLNNNKTMDDSQNLITTEKQTPSPLLLSKWLESAARFQPSESNYSWWAEEKKKNARSPAKFANMTSWARHDRDEVEAAVALTALAAAAATLS